MATLKIRESIRREIAQAIVKQSDPGYDTRYMGESFAVDTDGDGELDAVYFRESQAQWNPWHDEATAVSVSDIYADSGCTFDPTPEPELMGDMDPDDDPAYDDAEQAAVDLAYSECPNEIDI